MGHLGIQMCVILCQIPYDLYMDVLYSNILDLYVGKNRSEQWIGMLISNLTYDSCEESPQKVQALYVEQAIGMVKVCFRLQDTSGDTL